MTKLTTSITYRVFSLRHLPRAAAICKGLESALPLDCVVREAVLDIEFHDFPKLLPRHMYI